MSDNPIWMRMDGYGNAIVGNQKPHWQQRNPVVEGYGKPDGSSIERPYIATLSGGLNVDEAAARQECQLCTALDNFFGSDTWEGCLDYIINNNDKALVCDTLIAHRTLLRKSHGNSEAPNPPIHYWKIENDKPVLNLMVTKRYSVVPVVIPEWCLGANISLCFNPDGFGDDISEPLYCHSRDLRFYTPHPTKYLYSLCTSQDPGMQTGWNITEQDESFYIRTIGGWRYDTNQDGDGAWNSHGYCYQTLAQILVPLGEERDEPLSGWDTNAQLGFRIPDWSNPESVDWVYAPENYCAPMMYLSGGDFDDYKAILENTYYTRNSYGEECYYCAMLHPHIQSHSLPGLYRCTADGQLYRIVTGACTIILDHKTTSWRDETFPDYNMCSIQTTYNRHVEFYEYFTSTSWIVNNDALTTLIISPTASGTPPYAIDKFIKDITFSFQKDEYDGDVSIEIVGGKAPGSCGITKISISEPDNAGMCSVTISIDLKYCYDHGVGPFRVMVKASGIYGVPYSIPDIYIPESKIPEDLVWEPVEGYDYSYCRILPPRHY